MKLKIVSLLLLLFLVSCFSTRDLSSTNMVSYYKPTEHMTHPEFVLENQSDSSLKVYIRIKPDEFLFVRQTDETFKSFINVVAEVVTSYESLKTLDSASARFALDMTDKSKQKLLSLSLPVRHSGLLLVRITMFDLNRNSSDDFFVPLDREASPSRNDFLLCGKSGQPLFRNYLSSTDTFRLNYKNRELDSAWCRYYHREFILAPPPYTFDMHEEFVYAPDSLFKIAVNDSNGIVLPNEGFYQFQIDTSNYTGFTIYRFTSGFPSVVSPAQMIEALRYLLTKREYETMKTNPNLKAAVDEFWLSRGGGAEKTRALIKKYYGRVQEANRLFTSYTEGWRTDRGMIYIIFGMPTTINLGAESESWIYGTAGSSLAVNFFFTKVNNPFTYNDYTLSRTPIYEANWYRAVETWRQGRAYNSFN
ncbi:MAG: GWxTD domain-containing protein [Bacteroidetes bacterium]|nr:GWxTD domain-containing protein [Bacteroidota bacterium]